ncbi:hypothetical protein D3C78_1497190 [compost metagenome]
MILKTKLFFLTIMRLTALIMGITLTVVNALMFKIGIFGIILLFALIDSDNKNRLFRVSILFVLGAIFGYAYKFFS